MFLRQDWRLTRIASALITIIFSLTTVAWGVPEAAGISGLRVQNKSSSDFNFPSDLGSVQRIFLSNDTVQTARRFVVYIQDVHADPETQRNISGIIAHYRKSFGIETILLEGASGEADLSRLRNFPHAEIKREVAGQYLAESKLTGAEFEAVTSLKDYRLLGLEDAELYERHREAFFENARVRAQNEKILQKLLVRTERQKEKTFNKELLAFDRVIALSFVWTTKLRTTLDYAGLQNRGVASREAGTPRNDDAGSNPDLISYLARRARELGVDFDHLKQVRLFLRIQVLSALLEMPWLGAGKIERARYEKRVLELQEDFDAAVFSAESEALIEAVKEKLFKSEKEKSLDQYSRYLDLLGKLIRLKMTPEDLRRYEELSSGAARPSPEGLSLNPALEFYRLARARDGALAKRAVEQSNEAGRAFLITGGFHGPAIERALEESGISFVSVLPRTGERVDARRYAERMLVDPGFGYLKHTLTPRLLSFDPLFREAFLARANRLAKERYGTAKVLAQTKLGFGSDAWSARGFKTMAAPVLLKNIKWWSHPSSQYIGLGKKRELEFLLQYIGDDMNLFWKVAQNKDGELPDSVMTAFRLYYGLEDGIAHSRDETARSMGSHLLPHTAWRHAHLGLKLIFLVAAGGLGQAYEILSRAPREKRPEIFSKMFSELGRLQTRIAYTEAMRKNRPLNRKQMDEQVDRIARELNGRIRRFAKEKIKGGYDTLIERLSKRGAGLGEPYFSHKLPKSPYVRIITTIAAELNISIDELLGTEKFRVKLPALEKALRGKANAAARILYLDRLSDLSLREREALVPGAQSVNQRFRRERSEFIRLETLLKTAFLRGISPGQLIGSVKTKDYEPIPEKRPAVVSANGVKLELRPANSRLATEEAAFVTLKMGSAAKLNSRLDQTLTFTPADLITISEIEIYAKSDHREERLKLEVETADQMLGAEQRYKLEINPLLIVSLKGAEDAEGARSEALAPREVPWRGDLEPLAEFFEIRWSPGTLNLTVAPLVNAVEVEVRATFLKEQIAKSAGKTAVPERPAGPLKTSRVSVREATRHFLPLSMRKLAGFGSDTNDGNQTGADGEGGAGRRVIHPGRSRQYNLRLDASRPPFIWKPGSFFIGTHPFNLEHLSTRERLIELFETYGMKINVQDVNKFPTNSFWLISFIEGIRVSQLLGIFRLYFGKGFLDMEILTTASGAGLGEWITRGELFDILAGIRRKFESPQAGQPLRLRSGAVRSVPIQISSLSEENGNPLLPREVSVWSNPGAGFGTAPRKGSAKSPMVPVVPAHDERGQNIPSAGFGAGGHDLEIDRGFLLGELHRLDETRLATLENTLRFGVTADLFDRLPQAASIRNFFRNHPADLEEELRSFYPRARQYIYDNLHILNQLGVLRNLDRFIFFNDPPPAALNPQKELEAHVPEHVRRILGLDFPARKTLTLSFSTQNQFQIAAVELKNPHLLQPVLDLIREIRTRAPVETPFPKKRGPEYLRAEITNAVLQAGNGMFWRHHISRLKELLITGVHPDLAEEAGFNRDRRRLRDFIIQFMNNVDRRAHFPVEGKDPRGREPENRKYLFFPSRGSELWAYQMYVYYERLLFPEDALSKVLGEYLGIDFTKRHPAAVAMNPETVVGVEMKFPDRMGDVIELIERAEEEIAAKHLGREEQVWDENAARLRQELTALKKENPGLFGELYLTFLHGIHPALMKVSDPEMRSRFIADVAPEDRGKFATFEEGYYDYYFFFTAEETPGMLGVSGAVPARARAGGGQDGRPLTHRSPEFDWLPNHDSAGISYGAAIPKSVELVLGMQANAGRWFTAHMLLPGSGGRAIRRAVRVARIEFLGNREHLLRLMERVRTGFGARDDEPAPSSKRSVKGGAQNNSSESRNFERALGINHPNARDETMNKLRAGEQVDLHKLPGRSLRINADEVAGISSIQVTARTLGRKQRKTELITMRFETTGGKARVWGKTKVVANGLPFKENGEEEIFPNDKRNRFGTEFIQVQWKTDGTLYVGQRQADAHSQIKAEFTSSQSEGQGFGAGVELGINEVIASRQKKREEEVNADVFPDDAYRLARRGTPNSQTQEQWFRRLSKWDQSWSSFSLSVEPDDKPKQDEINNTSEDEGSQIKTLRRDESPENQRSEDNRSRIDGELFNGLDLPSVKIVHSDPASLPSGGDRVHDDSYYVNNKLFIDENPGSASVHRTGFGTTAQDEIEIDPRIAVFAKASTEFQAILENARTHIEEKYDDKDIRSWIRGMLRQFLDQVSDDLGGLRERIEQAQGKIDHRLFAEFLLLELYKFDPMTAKHSIGVANVMASIAKQKGLSKEEIQHYWWGGILHDIGKLFIPRKILFNPDGGTMTEKDFDFIRRHAMLGNIIVNPFNLRKFRHALYHHHRELIKELVQTEDERLLARTAFFADLIETIGGGRIIVAQDGAERVYSEPQPLEKVLGIISQKFSFLIGDGFESLDYSNLSQIALKTGKAQLGKAGALIEDFVRTQLLGNEFLEYEFPLLRAHLQSTGFGAEFAPREAVATFEISSNPDLEELNSIFSNAEKILGSIFAEPIVVTDSVLAMYLTPEGHVMTQVDQLATRNTYIQSDMIRDALANAIDAIADEAERLQARYEGRIVLRVYRDNGKTIIEISDNGVGMHPDILRSLRHEETVTSKTGLRLRGKMRYGFKGQAVSRYFEIAKATRGVVEIDTKFVDGAPIKRRIDFSKAEDVRWDDPLAPSSRQESGTTLRWVVPDTKSDTHRTGFGAASPSEEPFSERRAESGAKKPDRKLLRPIEFDSRFVIPIPGTSIFLLRPETAFSVITEVETDEAPYKVTWHEGELGSYDSLKQALDDFSAKVRKAKGAAFFLGAGRDALSVYATLFNLARETDFIDVDWLDKNLGNLLPQLEAITRKGAILIPLEQLQNMPDDYLRLMLGQELFHDRLGAWLQAVRSGKNRVKKEKLTEFLAHSEKINRRMLSLLGYGKSRSVKTSEGKLDEILAQGFFPSFAEGINEVGSIELTSRSEILRPLEVALKIVKEEFLKTFPETAEFFTLSLEEANEAIMKIRKVAPKAGFGAEDIPDGAEEWESRSNTQHGAKITMGGRVEYSMSEEEKEKWNLRARELIGQIQSENKDVRDIAASQFLKHTEGLVRSVIKKYGRDLIRRFDMEYLVNFAGVHVIDSARRFDLDRETRAAPFVFQRVKWGLGDLRREMGASVISTDQLGEEGEERAGAEVNEQDLDRRIESSRREKFSANEKLRFETLHSLVRAADGDDEKLWKIVEEAAQRPKYKAWMTAFKLTHGLEDGKFHTFKSAGEILFDTGLARNKKGKPLSRSRIEQMVDRAVRYLSDRIGGAEITRSTRRSVKKRDSVEPVASGSLLPTEGITKQVLDRFQSKIAARYGSGEDFVEHVKWTSRRELNPRFFTGKFSPDAQTIFFTAHMHMRYVDEYLGTEAFRRDMSLIRNDYPDKLSARLSFLLGLLDLTADGLAREAHLEEKTVQSILAGTYDSLEGLSFSVVMSLALALRVSPGQLIELPYSEDIQAQPLSPGPGSGPGGGTKEDKSESSSPEKTAEEVPDHLHIFPPQTDSYRLAGFGARVTGDLITKDFSGPHRGFLQRGDRWNHPEVRRSDDIGDLREPPKHSSFPGSSLPEGKGGEGLEQAFQFDGRLFSEQQTEGYDKDGGNFRRRKSSRTERFKKSFNRSIPDNTPQALIPVRRALLSLPSTGPEVSLARIDSPPGFKEEHKGKHLFGFGRGELAQHDSQRTWDVSGNFHESDNITSNLLRQRGISEQPEESEFGFGAADNRDAESNQDISALFDSHAGRWNVLKQARFSVFFGEGQEDEVMNYARDLINRPGVRERLHRLNWSKIFQRSKRPMKNQVFLRLTREVLNSQGEAGKSIRRFILKEFIPWAIDYDPEAVYFVDVLRKVSGDLNPSDKVERETIRSMMNLFRGGPRIRNLTSIDGLISFLAQVYFEEEVLYLDYEQLRPLGKEWADVHLYFELRRSSAGRPEAVMLIYHDLYERYEGYFIDAERLSKHGLNLDDPLGRVISEAFKEKFSEQHPKRKIWDELNLGFGAEEEESRFVDARELLHQLGYTSERIRREIEYDLQKWEEERDPDPRGRVLYHMTVIGLVWEMINGKGSLFAGSFLATDSRDAISEYANRYFLSNTDQDMRPIVLAFDGNEIAKRGVGITTPVQYDSWGREFSPNSYRQTTHPLPLSALGRYSKIDVVVGLLSSPAYPKQKTKRDRANQRIAASLGYDSWNDLEISLELSSVHVQERVKKAKETTRKRSSRSLPDRKRNESGFGAVGSPLLKDEAARVLPEDEQRRIDTAVRFVEHVKELEKMRDKEPAKFRVSSRHAAFEGITGRKVLAMLRKLKTKYNDFSFVEALDFLSKNHPLFYDVRFKQLESFRYLYEAYLRGIPLDSSEEVAIRELKQFVDLLFHPRDKNIQRTVARSYRQLNEEFSKTFIYIVLNRISLYAESNDAAQRKIAQAFLSLLLDDVVRSKFFTESFLFNKSIVEGFLKPEYAAEENVGVVYLLNGSHYLYKQARQIAEAVGADTSRLHAIYVNREIAKGDQRRLRKYLMQALSKQRRLTSYNRLVIVDTGTKGSMARKIFDVLSAAGSVKQHIHGRLLEIESTKFDNYKTMDVLGWNHVLIKLGLLKYDGDFFGVDDVYAERVHMLLLFDWFLPREFKSPTRLARTKSGRIEPVLKHTDLPVFAKIAKDAIRKGTQALLDKDIRLPDVSNSNWDAWLPGGARENILKQGFRSVQLGNDLEGHAEGERGSGDATSTGFGAADRSGEDVEINERTASSSATQRGKPLPQSPMFQSQSELKSPFQSPFGGLGGIKTHPAMNIKNTINASMILTRGEGISLNQREAAPDPDNTIKRVKSVEPTFSRRNGSNIEEVPFQMKGVVPDNLSFVNNNFTKNKLPNGFGAATVEIDPRLAVSVPSTDIFLLPEKLFMVFDLEMRANADGKVTAKGHIYSSFQEAKTDLIHKGLVAGGLVLPADTDPEQLYANLLSLEKLEGPVDWLEDKDKIVGQLRHIFKKRNVFLSLALARNWTAPELRLYLAHEFLHLELARWFKTFRQKSSKNGGECARVVRWIDINKTSIIEILDEARYAELKEQSALRQFEELIAQMMFTSSLDGIEADGTVVANVTGDRKLDGDISSGLEIRRTQMNEIGQEFPILRDMFSHALNRANKNFPAVQRALEKGFGAASIVIPDAEAAIRDGEITAEGILDLMRDGRTRIHLVFAGMESWEEAAQFIEVAFGPEAKAVFPLVEIHTARTIRRASHLSPSASPERLKQALVSRLSQLAQGAAVVIDTGEAEARNARKNVQHLFAHFDSDHVHPQLLSNAIFLSRLNGAEAIDEAVSRGLQRVGENRWRDVLTVNPAVEIMDQRARAKAFDVAA